MHRILRIILILLLIAQCTACHHRTKTMSFYYWRTRFKLDSTEKAALAFNDIRTLYIRYFDVDRPPGQTSAAPVAPISFSSPVPGQQVVPVVFLRNRVFDNTDSAAIIALSENIYHLVSQINAKQDLHTASTQFDCDWTEKTRGMYFLFLSRYRTLSRLPISCTIRLHQVKYPARTGIPPVDLGLLMYYNMGNIDAGPDNSIYNPSIAARYIPSLQTYPLSLDIAIPIFSWGLLIRDGRVISLLDKMNFHHFENDPNFTRQSDGRYRAKTAGFSGGYYFKQGDLVKIEHIDAAGLASIADNINRYTNHRLHNIIFYDLDHTNLQLYEKNDFGKILDRFD